MNKFYQEPEMAKEKRGLNILFLSTSATRFGSIVAQSVVPLYVVSYLNLSPAIASALITILWISNGIGSVLGGTINKFKFNLLFGFLISIIGLSLLITSRDITTLFASIFLFGMGLGSISLLLPPLMHTLTGVRESYEGIGFYSLGLSLGLIIGALASSLILKFFGFHYVFFAVIIYLGITLTFLFNLKINNGNINKFNLKGLFNVLKNRLFLNVYLINFLYSLLLPLIISYWGIYEEEVNNLKPSYALFFIFILFLTSTFIRYRLIKLDARSIKKLKFYSILLLPVVFIFIYSGNLYLGLLSVVVFSLPHAVVYPASLYEAYTSIDEKDILSGNYVFLSSSGIAEFLSPFIATLILSKFFISYIYVYAIIISFFALLASIINIKK